MNPPVSSTMRRSNKPGEQDLPRIEVADGVWHIRSAEAARQILRTRDVTTQAGFTAEVIPEGKLRNKPILFMDGEEHRQQRAKVARYFAPKTVSTRYRALMETRADELIAEMKRSATFKLDQISLRYSVEVAAQVIGLTNSPMGPMARRLEKFFDQPSFDLTKKNAGRSKLQAIQAFVKGNLPMLTFYFFDVLPAIRARRKNPEQDVITHLINEGYSNPNILIECVTYGAAGMVTTREFISMATWHLLTNEELRHDFVTGDEKSRLAILYEILRLEPIVGHLYRRAQADIDITDGDDRYTIPQGALIDIYIRQANADPKVVGEEPLNIRPGRTMPRGVGEEVISFGDGAHKCPGNSLAIQETEVLLSRLLAEDLQVLQEPSLHWDDLIAGYALRDFVLAIPEPDSF